MFDKKKYDNALVSYKRDFINKQRLNGRKSTMRCALNAEKLMAEIWTKRIAILFLKLYLDYRNERSQERSF